MGLHKHKIYDMLKLIFVFTIYVCPFFFFFVFLFYQKSEIRYHCYIINIMVFALGCTELFLFVALLEPLDLLYHVRFCSQLFF